MHDPIIIEIMTKKECCLCDTVKETVRRTIADYPARLQLTDIESDPALFERYKEKIPVVLINGEESFVYKVRESVLRKKLDAISGKG
ncbi:MAG: glutaredoxin family protein [Nitrospinae bacterium]|nr:glutaredoxin family protein [Nitrospinota bacterium]